MLNFRCSALSASGGIRLKQLLAALIVGGYSFGSLGQTTLMVPAAESSIQMKAPPKGLTLSVTAGLGAKDVSDELVRNTGARSFVLFDGGQKFSEYFSAYLSAGAFFGESIASDLYGREGASYSAVGVNYAYVSINPLPRVRLDAGVLARNFSTLPATFRTDGFLGAQESFTLGDKKSNYLELNASQILPSSSTAEKRAGEHSKVPLLMMAGGEAGIRVSDTILIKPQAQYFAFYNLTSIAADASRNYNSVIGWGSDNARFRYRFEGVQGATSIENQWSPDLKTSLHLGYILNRKAGKGTGEGYSAALSADYQMGGVNLSPMVGLYYNERNVLPAVYADVSNNLGKTNRLATSYYLKVSVPEQNYSFYGRYVQTDLIEEENSLSDRRIITVGMEANYDIF